MTKHRAQIDCLAQPWLAFPESEWSTARPSERLTRWKERLLNEPRQIDTQRAILTTESYQQTVGQPMPIRRAKMLLRLCQHTELHISPEELIIGNRSALPRMGVIAPEGAVDWVDSELETLSTRPQDRFQITHEQISLLRKRVFTFWRGHALQDAVDNALDPEVKDAVSARIFSVNQTDHAQGHILPDVETWLKDGVSGLRRRVQNAHREPGHSGDHRFHKAAEIALDAASELMARYARLARQMISMSSDHRRKKELLEIANRCQWLCEHPARNYAEALQAIWFLFVLLQIESNASSFSPGRMDQYLLPYLKRDLRQGKLSLEAAQELLGHLWLKFNEIVLLRSSASARYFAGFPIGFNIAIGGQDAAGRDATNLLSYMCLRAQATIGLTQPNLSLRVHAGSPERLLSTATYVIGRGSGMPQVFGDAVIIAGQTQRGIDQRDARDYAVVGCVELSTPGRALGWSDAAMFNMVRLLELTLFGGRDPQTGALDALACPTLDNMDSYATLERCYERQLAYFVPLMVRGCNTVDQLHAELLPSPFLSLHIQDCIASGIDVTAGGARYNLSGVQGVQIANVADSMLAIKTAVFDEGWLAAETLLAALEANWIGHECLRQHLLAMPKFGNDDPTVDHIARRWTRCFSDLVSEHTNPRGGPYHTGFYTVSAHIPMGSHVGATPDGRLAGSPLADGGLSPSAGRDTKGPTAVLASVGALDLDLASNGTLLNLKFLPSLFESDEGRESFVSLLRGFERSGVPHVQFNVVGDKTLRKAQQHPDAFRHLVVRVAGYSAYFTELDRSLQNEIINRTSYREAG